MDKVVHFEITFDDHARAKEFYGSVFDWKLDDNDMGGVVYTTATTVPIDEQMRPTEPGRGAVYHHSPTRSATASLVQHPSSARRGTLRSLGSQSGRERRPPLPDRIAIA